MKHLWKHLFLADFLALHCPFTKGKEKTFRKQISFVGAKHSVWNLYTSTSCNFSLKTCILPKVISWVLMMITWQIGITVRPFARWRRLHSHLWGIKTLLRVLSQILSLLQRRMNHKQMSSVFWTAICCNWLEDLWLFLSKYANFSSEKTIL